MKELNMSDIGHYIWLDANVENAKISDWERLELVIRKWAVLSAHEKQQSDYQKRKEMYE
jgi:hypothetical protein